MSLFRLSLTDATDDQEDAALMLASGLDNLRQIAEVATAWANGVRAAAAKARR